MFAPSEIPVDATYIRINNVPINILRNGVFSNLTVCVEITLYNCNISVVEEDAFLGLVNLTALLLYRNKIRTMETLTGTFNHLHSLRSLYLEYNKLTIIQAGMLENLTNLSWLDIQYNEINKTEPGAFRGLSGLVDLYSSGNKLWIIKSETFKTLSALKNLWLHSNNISIIELGAFEDLKTLTYLSLESNRLT